MYVIKYINLTSSCRFPFDLSQPISMFQIPYRNISAWSELKTQPGFMAAFNRRDFEAKVRERIERGEDNSLPLTVVLDNVRSPDNMGALLRVAAAAGCKAVVAMKGCVDVWQPKVMRSAAGAHLFMPIMMDVPWHEVNHYLPKCAQVVLADLDRSDDTSDQQEPLSAQTLGQRLAALEERCLHFRETYSLKEDDESGDLRLPKSLINVRDKDLEGKSEQELGSIVAKAIAESSSGAKKNDFSFYEEDIVREYCDLPLPSKQCWDFEPLHSGQELLVVIGGETEGMGPCAKKLAHERLGERVFIPLRRNVDSLNVASAASVILFEIVRKLRASSSSSLN